MKVTRIERVETEAGAELRARVRSEDGRLDGRSVWLRYPPEHAEHRTDRADPFVPALLLAAMRLHAPLEVEGPVTTRLLHGADKFMRIMHGWDRGYRPVPVRADEAPDRPVSGTAVAAFFSGGVDSFYTVLKNARAPNLPASERISHLIFVRGFDIRLDREHDALYKRALECVRSTAKALDKQVIRVQTNLKEVVEPVAGWNMYYGQALAAAALGLAGFLRRVHVPAGHNVTDAPPRGSHVLLDPLWGTKELEVVHDGGEATRAEKVLWEVGRSPVALDHLRVCWENLGGKYNCGRCEKCIRTMVNLRVAGVLDRCRTFDRGLDLFEVANLPLRDANDRAFVRENLEALEARGGDPELRSALEASLSPWAVGRPRHLLGRLPRPVARAAARLVWRLDRALLGGRLRRWYRGRGGS
jgi:hypothetical protein